MEYTSENRQNIAAQNEKNGKIYRSCFRLNNISLLISSLTAVLGFGELLLVFVHGLLSFTFGWLKYEYTSYRICAFLTRTIFLSNIVGLILNIVSYKKTARFSNGRLLFITSLLIMAEDTFLIFSSAYFIVTKYKDVGFRNLSFCIVASLISLIFAVISAQKNRCYKEDSVMKIALVIIDSTILAVGVIVSIMGTLKAVQFSKKYVPYFLFAVLGIVLIAVMIRLIKKKFTFILGIGFILFYLVFAGFGYIVCETNAARIKRLSYFEGKTVTLAIDGESYAWTGEALYDSKALEPVDVSESEAYFMADEIEWRVYVVYVMPGEDKTIYYEFIEASDYMIMKKTD